MQDFDVNKQTSDYVKKILSFRNEFLKHKGKSKPFLNTYYLNIANQNIPKPLKPGTIKNDYPDVTIRLLKLSG